MNYVHTWGKKHIQKKQTCRTYREAGNLKLISSEAKQKKQKSSCSLPETNS